MTRDLKELEQKAADGQSATEHELQVYLAEHALRWAVYYGTAEAVEKTMQRRQELDVRECACCREKAS